MSVYKIWEHSDIATTKSNGGSNSSSLTRWKQASSLPESLSFEVKSKVIGLIGDRKGGQNYEKL